MRNESERGTPEAGDECGYIRSRSLENVANTHLSEGHAAQIGSKRIELDVFDCATHDGFQSILSQRASDDHHPRGRPCT